MPATSVCKSEHVRRHRVRPRDRVGRRLRLGHVWRWRRSYDGRATEALDNVTRRPGVLKASPRACHRCRRDELADVEETKWCALCLLCVATADSSRSSGGALGSGSENRPPQRELIITNIITWLLITSHLDFSLLK